MENIQKETKIGRYKIGYYQKGRGKVLLLLHSLLNTAYSFRHVYGPLSDKYKVIMPDLLGCGYSTKPDDFDFTLKSFAEHLKQFLDKLKVTKLSIGGVSGSGAIALKFTTMFPDMVEKLVLIDALGMEAGRSGSVRGLPVRGNVNDKDMVLRLYLSQFNDPSAVSADEREKIAELAVREDVPACTHKILQANGDFSVDGIEDIKVPTLIIWGEKDPVLPKIMAENFANKMPNSQYVMIPEAGHLPHEESPEDFNTVLLDFLKGNLPKSS
ncbi:MAG: alpha/beta hydrolase [candidate division Zixibacteria bacterium]|nr:alpha/beta hydrolase [candidate division Zixibacteria bacterium]NIR66128.1 alpha/beta hydrolase [candidate division Zixibacteria bacterium]NIS15859.1 alpha/beta hydrolase [candidate division Zixibacteria bacterium]NIS47749.1 alpha/beta hydrolase [candidate division Zixibacteria bacterium]NIT54484.1 alpha/beta hydrolase [candidate division Zixibacteria bacterium]